MSDDDNDNNEHENDDTIDNNNNNNHEYEEKNDNNSTNKNDNNNNDNNNDDDDNDDIMDEFKTTVDEFDSKTIVVVDTYTNIDRHSNRQIFQNFNNNNNRNNHLLNSFANYDTKWNTTTELTVDAIKKIPSVGLNQTDDVSYKISSTNCLEKALLKLNKNTFTQEMNEGVGLY